MIDPKVHGEFQAHRPRLVALAQRMLGSRTEAEDALQDAWLRVERTDATDVDNLGGWFTTITARVCLNMLRLRMSRREDPFDDVRPDPNGAQPGPEFEATLAESIGVALTVVFETLEPVERVAFVLHDMFAIPFDEIAAIIDRTPAATRQLASRARRRVHARESGVDTVRFVEQRRAVDAFFTAARLGRLEDLLVVLDPDVSLSNWAGPSRDEATVVVRGAARVAGRALLFAKPEADIWPVMVCGRPGVLATVNDERIALMVFDVTAGAITSIDALTDPDRLARIHVCVS